MMELDFSECTVFDFDCVHSVNSIPCKLDQNQFHLFDFTPQIEFTVDPSQVKSNILTQSEKIPSGEFTKCDSQNKICQYWPPVKENVNFSDHIQM